MLGAVPVIILIVVFAINFPMNGSSSPLVWVLLAVMIVILLAALVAGLYIGKRFVGDRIELAFRNPGGKWRHGRVQISPQTLVLQPCWWQTRFPSGAPITLNVDNLAEDTGRRPQAKQWWSLNPQLSIVSMQTDQGEYEIAALPSHLAELRERLLEPAAS